MADYVIVKKSDLVSLADEIRAKSGLTNKFKFPADFVSALGKVEGGGSASEFGEKLYSFGVLSDIHISTTTSSAADNFESALAMYENMGIDMVCISGDITDSSGIAEMNRFNSICANHPGISVHFCDGNHDKTITDANWQSYFGRARNYELILNDDVFLFMSFDYNFSSSSSAYTQGLAWVREKLARYKGSRIFLFMHFPPSGYSGLVEGQYYGFSANAQQDDELITLLNTTKNVTVFHGHTHYDFDVQEHSNEVNVYRFNASDVNLIHVPACAYLRDENWGNYYAGQGWLVNVYEKGFALTGYDVQTGEVVENTEYFFVTDNVEVMDNAILIDTIDATLRDGESVSVKVSLAEAKSATVRVASNNSLVTVSPTALTFTSSNYNVPQTVTIHAPDSIASDGSCQVTFSGDGMSDKVTSVTLLYTDKSGTAVLAPNSSWWRGTTARSTITAINIVDSVASVPSGSSETWDASENQNESVTAYVNGTTLYLAGNGSGSIALTADGSYTFSDINNADFFTSLTSISGINLLDTSAATTMIGMFKSCRVLTSLDLRGFNMESVTDSREMFIYCNALSTINMSGVNASSLEYASNMFWDCKAVTSLDLSGFNSPNLKSASYLFYNCKSLSSLNISNLNVAKVDNFGHMFDGCESLTSLDLSHFVTTFAEEMNAMFKDCISLASLDVSSFNTSGVMRMDEMFDHCDVLTTLNISNFDTYGIDSPEGLYRFARKSGIRNLTVGANFVQDYNMHPAGSDGMFYTSSSTPLTITGANSVLRTYNFATDNRTVTFA